MYKSVLTLGTFDGVHRGHQALVRKVIARARARRARSSVLAFGMPPRHAGEPPVNPVLLTTLSEKLQILKRLGIGHVQVLVFNRKIAATLPGDFFQRTVIEKHGAVEMVVGPRVAFGKNRGGRLPHLKRLGQKYGVKIHVVSNVVGGKGFVSSRRIRALLARGSIEKANALLGYPYSVAGKVIHGSHRGRRLGFPTANLHPEPGKILPRGVYWVKVLPAGVLPFGLLDLAKGMDGLCNVGIRPTFAPDSQALHCEVYLFDASVGRPRNAKSLNLYGRKLRVVFLRKIRAEKQFTSSEGLKRQIAMDLKTARLYKKAHFSI